MDNIDSFSEPITILIPTYNRSKFLPLCLLNIKSQQYPHHLLNVIIDDDGEEDFIQDLNQVKNYLAPIDVKYIKRDTKRTIGKKRNDLIKECKTKIFCFLDDDDIYFPTYITHSYQVMKFKKAGCVGCDKMVFCMTERDFDLHAIDCGNRAVMIHEATIMMTKKWYKASCKFANNSCGEGKNIFTGHERNVAITDIMKIMCCVQHPGNTINKLQFANEDNKLDFSISEEFKKLLHDILKK